ncbi:hypothetical protein [Nocardia lijiangensis]|uniref:hypothetical protein n=1 Tax=Nocardia lijiangensis TaxID=299618 RepID=UPI00082F1D10|nr:hypothetical protein [Nocardia lijiangensis]
MNPDDVLRDLRASVALVLSENRDDEIYLASKSPVVLEAVARWFRDLDLWLSAGGQAPQPWRLVELPSSPPQQ